MPVNSVQMPNRQSNGLDQLGKVLGIIQAAYGIKTDYERSKLQDEQLKAAKRANEVGELNKQGIYVPGQESDFLHYDTPVPGSRELVFQRIKRNDDLSPVIDENGQPVIEQYKSNVISKDAATSMGMMTKNDAANLQVQAATIRSEGGIPPEDLFNYDIEKTEKPGFQKTWTPLEGKPVEIWARKKGFKQPTVNGKNIPSKDIPGYENAVASGISNPTPQDIFDYNPENIHKDIATLTNKVSSNSIPETVALLNNIDNLIGGIDSSGPINGIGKQYSGANLPVIGGLVGSYTLDQNARDIRQTVGRLRDALIKKQAGGNVTDNEWQRASESLAAGAFASPDDLRRALKTTRDLMRREIQAYESGASKAAKDVYQSRKGAIHSDLPVFGKLRNDQNKIKSSSQMTNQEAIDAELGD